MIPSERVSDSFVVGSGIMDEVAKTPAQLKKEAKKMEKLAKFQAKQEKLVGHKTANNKPKQEKSSSKVLTIDKPIADESGKKGNFVKQYRVLYLLQFSLW